MSEVSQRIPLFSRMRQKLPMKSQSNNIPSSVKSIISQHQYTNTTSSQYSATLRQEGQHKKNFLDANYHSKQADRLKRKRVSTDDDLISENGESIGDVDSEEGDDDDSNDFSDLVDFIVPDKEDDYALVPCVKYQSSGFDAGNFTHGNL